MTGVTAPAAEPGSNEALGVHDLILWGMSLLFFIALPFGGFQTIAGDNRCHVSLWRALFHPHLVGAHGTPAPKAGLVVLLGATHDIDPDLIRVLLAVFAATLVWITARVASDASGPIAGAAAAAYLCWRTSVASMFQNGTTMVFFLPTLYVGLWLFARRRQALGAVVLGAAALFRIEALAVLLWLAASEQLFARRYRQFAMSITVAGAVVAVTTGMYHLLQRDLDRFDMGGIGSGYLFFVFPDELSRLVVPLAYAVRGPLLIALEHCLPPSPAVLAVVGWWFHPARRGYASLGSILLFLIVYHALVGGSYEVHYFDHLVPAICAFGAAGFAEVVSRARHGIRGAAALLIPGSGALVAVAILVPRLRGGAEWALVLNVVAVLTMVAARQLRKRLRLPARALGTVIVVVALGVAAIRAGGTETRLVPAHFTLDANTFLQAKPIPRGARVLIDDALTCGIVIDAPDWFAKVTPIQYFNVQDETRRRSILAETDFVLISRTDWPLYYLRYDPLGRAGVDTFRRAVWDVVTQDQPRQVYGHTLTPTVSPWPLVALRVD